MPRKPSPIQTETIANHIRDMIIGKRWNHALPSERELSNILSVGRETIRKALSNLEENGWIAPPQHNRPRIITRYTPDHDVQTPLQEQPSEVIGLITPIPIDRMPQQVLVELYEIEKVLEYDNLQLRVYEIPWAMGKKPGPKLDRLVHASPHICWILYQTSEETQLWFKQRAIPCLVRGSSHTSACLPFIDTHWEATARHAATHLWSRGHHTSVLCIPDSPLKGNQLMKKAFLEFQGEKWNPLFIPIPDQTDQFFNLLNNTFDAHPDITSFVVLRSQHAITLMSWAAAHSLPIPDKISIISLSYNPVLEHILPPIAHYKSNIRKTVRRLIRMLRALRKGTPFHSTYIIPDFHQGASVVQIPFNHK